MSDLFKRFTRAREKAVNDWQRNFVASYGTGYANGLAEYKRILGLQEKADKAEAEFWAGLAMFALSLCGGSALTLVFGNAAVKAAAGKVALDVICQNNMNRAFKVASFVSSNKTADFVLGELWDKGAGSISEKLKDALTEDPRNFSTIGKLAEEPQALQNHLNQWVLDAHNAVLLAEEETDSITSEVEKTKKIETLMKSAFFTTAPVKRPDEGVLARDIEFTFYMNMILDSDHVADGVSVLTKDATFPQTRVTSRTPINESPSSAKYPTSTYDRRMGVTQSTFFKEVQYQQFGSIIKDRINELSKERFHTKMWFTGPEVGVPFIVKGEKVDRELLRLAERRLNEMGSTNIGKIQRSLAQRP